MPSLPAAMKPSMHDIGKLSAIILMAWFVVLIGRVVQVVNFCYVYGFSRMISSQITGVHGIIIATFNAEGTVCYFLFSARVCS